ncbi:hypothetical protein IAI51_00245 [Pseudomonas sp. N40(2020)]|uniref:hypothetical protein n=1 Tax=Pseudomonas sp. N40(2020) TaxID=2767798 RepID=UPI001656D248|nr:hypothetical protein [Pseudomonas sp. N40(2020)]MBC8994962.1 hypothetical protein [Pseudomonas sp. N40(2020)]
MSKFLEVANTYKQALEADAEKLEHLRDVAQQVRRKFEEYLGVPSGNPVMINGREAPHVAIGDIDKNGNFTGIPKKEFQRSSADRIQFVIWFTYDPEPKPRTDGSISFHLQLEQIDKGYTIWLNDFEELKISLEDMTPLFDAMYQSAMEKARKAIH